MNWSKVWPEGKLAGRLSHPQSVETQSEVNAHAICIHNSCLARNGHKRGVKWATRRQNCEGKWSTNPRSKCGCSSQNRWVTILTKWDLNFLGIFNWRVTIQLNQQWDQCVLRIWKSTSTLASPGTWSGPPSTVTSPCRVSRQVQANFFYFCLFWILNYEFKILNSEDQFFWILHWIIFNEYSDFLFILINGHTWRDASGSIQIWVFCFFQNNSTSLQTFNNLKSVFKPFRFPQKHSESMDGFVVASADELADPWDDD